MSHEYAVSNCVKQGGVISPLLFNLHVQDLIECLLFSTERKFC